MSKISNVLAAAVTLFLFFVVFPPEAPAVEPVELFPKDSWYDYRDLLVEVSGTVLDENGQTVPGAIVVQTSDSMFHPDEPGITTCNDKGEYRLRVFAQVHYLPQIIAFSPDESRQGNTRARNAGRVENLDIVLKPVPRNSFKVVDAEQKPIAGAMVLYMTVERDHAKLVTDAEGRFAGYGNAFVVYKPGYGLAEVKFEEGSAPEEKTLVLEKAKQSRFKIIDDYGKPLPGLTVVPSTFYRDNYKSWIHTRWEPLRRRTDDQGNVEFDFVPSWVEERRLWLFPQIDEAFAPYFIPVTEGDRQPSPPVYSEEEDRYVQQVFPTAAVRGVLQTEDGRPAAGAIAELHPEKLMRWYGIMTDAKGRFEVRMPPGYPFTLDVQDKQGWAVIDRKIPVPADKPFEPLEIKLQETARIFGTVTEADGKTPLPNKYVKMLSISGGLQPSYEHGQYQDHSDERGNFEFYVIPRADYYIRCSPKDRDYNLPGPDDPYTRHVDATEPGKEYEVNFSLEKIEPIYLTGRVLLEGDPQKPVPGVDFEYVSASHIRMKSQSDAEGKFKLEFEENYTTIEATEKEKKLYGYLNTTPEMREIDIAVYPGVVVSGRLLRESDGKSIGNSSVTLRTTVQRGEDEKMGSASLHPLDSEGRFSVDSLMVNRTYELSAPLDYGDGDYEPDYHSGAPIGKRITSTDSSPIDLGEVRIPDAKLKPGVYNRIQWVFGNRYNKTPLDALWKTTRQKAAEEKKTILLVFFNYSQYERTPSMVQDLFKAYGKIPESRQPLLLGVPGAYGSYSQSVVNLAREAGIDLATVKGPTLVLLDANGKQIASSLLELLCEPTFNDAGELSHKFREDPFLLFLQQHE